MIRLQIDNDSGDTLSLEDFTNYPDGDIVLFLRIFNINERKELDVILHEQELDNLISELTKIKKRVQHDKY